MKTDAVSAALMLFARIPEPGKVKTRLIPALGADSACRLYSEMLRVGVAQLVEADADEAQLWLTGGGKAEVESLAGAASGIRVHQQCGDDLGQRMAFAFQYNFERGSRCVVVAGADCPGLRAQHYRCLLASLQQDDAVLIPALDGGYVAMGLRRYHPSLFEAMPWGQDTVYGETIARLENLNWTWCSLDALPDIDRPADLAHLAGTELEPWMR